jgi:hypothetical protein
LPKADLMHNLGNIMGPRELYSTSELEHLLNG